MVDFFSSSIQFSDSQELGGGDGQRSRQTFVEPLLEASFCFGITSVLESMTQRSRVSENIKAINGKIPLCLPLKAILCSLGQALLGHKRKLQDLPCVSLNSGKQ